MWRRWRPAASGALVALGAAACGTGPGGVAPQAATPIDTMTIRAAAKFLAADALRGRRTGTEGERLAAAYLARECQRLGFEPLFDAGSYYQPVPYGETRLVAAGTTVRVRGPGVDTTFAYHEDFIPDVGTAATLRDFGGPLAYVGRAQDILFRRSDLPDLHGRVALLRGEFGANGAAADTLRARGAIGVLEVVDDARRYRLFRQTRGPARLHVDDPLVAPSFIPPLPSVLAGPRMTVTLYQPITGVTHGSWNDAYLNGLAAGLPDPQLLDGWRADVTIAAEQRALQGMNVGCLLRGRGPAADTAIALTAHFDHLGTGAPNERGDSIYNGFADNAVGVAMSLAIGEAYAKDRAAGRGLRHSLLLLFFTGEEQGLLGADYFVARPRWPLQQLLGVVNLDGNAPAGRPRAWRVSGDDETALVRLVVDEVARRGWTSAVAPPSPASDHFAFVKRGVPAVFFVPSDGPYEGLDVTVSDSLRRAVWGHYHQPSDEYRESFPFSGLERYAAFARDVVRRLDQLPRAARR
ncbi:MAG: M28 family peptidase [Gemmatimonadales bacterium]|nr:M28 family peptidase [Gemmatimonadales bacterium]